MTKEQVFELIKNNPIFALATAEENRPHVRMILLFRADTNGVVFVTGENKDLNRQLSQNENVEMCFFSPKENRQIRIFGSVEQIEDLDYKKKVVKEFKFLKEWVDKEGYDVLVVYCLKHGKATTWTMATNFKPKEYIQL
jgi:pyridoxamine 5'-phosphate oxidase